ncbi:HET domain containing protein [Naviculisporaceae sp. PSN 640]
MRLLHVDTKEVHDFQAAPYPPYAILSHTWGNDGDEVTFQEMMNLPTSSSSDAARVCQKPGYRKIEQCCARARADEIEYVWIDTCCIDKTSSAELSEAINSMYEWYRGSRICYALLSDVSTAPTGLFDDAESVIQGSRWLTRGWTLQELVAPAVVEFYAADWTEIGTKLSLAAALASITGIDQSVLAGRRSVLSCNVAERMSWAADRSTKRLEDAAYSLLGLFGVAMPLIYGEGRSRSFERLQEEIMRTTEDYTMVTVLESSNPGGPWYDIY